MRDRPVLVDPGFSTAEDDTLKWLRAEGVAPEDVSLVLNTHWHVDHTRDNAVLHEVHGIPIAAHHHVGHTIRSGGDMCDAAYLRHPARPYSVDRVLQDGDVLRLSEHIELEVVATPGHSADHVSFYLREQQVLIAGDILSLGVVAWLDVARHGTRPIHDALRSLRRLSSLPVGWVCSGHGPPFRLAPAIRSAVSTYEAWLQDPRLACTHAAKSILLYELSLHGEVEDSRLEAIECAPWFLSHRECLPDSLGTARRLLRRLERDGRVERRGKAWSLRRSGATPE